MLEGAGSLVVVDEYDGVGVRTATGPEDEGREAVGLGDGVERGATLGPHWLLI